MTFQTLIKLMFLLPFTSSFSNFRKCLNINEENNMTILSSLNGEIQGSCYDVALDYSGYKPNLNKKVLVWLSIPYAQPPIENLRFKEPVPVKSWTNRLDETKFSHKCVQFNGKEIDDDSSEDCLYLNIIVPYDLYYKTTIQKDETLKAPIFLWVHGGSNIGGSASEDYYDALTLVALSEMIVVTINYRLGPFGFFTIFDTEAKGNQGLKDQTLAFQWVYENAHLFGGDQLKITIGGESAGAWDVGFHLLYKPSWPYFRNAIMESGNPADISSHLKSPNEATKFALDAGLKLGCNVSNNLELFICLQSMSSNIFYSTSYRDFRDHVDLYMPLVLDPEVFSKQPRKLIESGDFKKCSILIGTNTLEMISFISREHMDLSKVRQELTYNPGSLSYDLQKYFDRYNLISKDDFFDKMIELYGLNQRNCNDNLFMDYVEMITDECYKCPTYFFAEHYSKFHQNAYVYLYGQKLSTSKWYPEDGADHGAELATVFAQPLSSNKYPVHEKSFTEKIVNYWKSFISSNDPNVPDNDLNFWFPFNNDTSTNERNVLYLKAGNIKNTKYNLSDPKCIFWNL